MSLLALTMHGASAAGEGSLKAWVEAETLDGFVSLRGAVVSEEARELTYKFSIRKKGASGMSTTRQGGRVSLKAGEVSYLSTSRVNAKEDDSLHAELTLYGANGDLLKEVQIDANH